MSQSPKPLETYKELKQEADNRNREEVEKKNFKEKIKSISFKRVKGGGREH